MEEKKQRTQSQKKIIRAFIYRGWVGIEIWSGNPGRDDDSELLDEYYVEASYVHIKYKPSRSITIMYPKQFMTFTEDQHTKIEVYDKSVDYIECSSE